MSCCMQNQVDVGQTQDSLKKEFLWNKNKTKQKGKSNNNFNKNMFKVKNN